jgi:hypothetical protein
MNTIQPSSVDSPANTCQRCGKARHTTLVLFQSNVSLLFRRQERKVCGHFCLSCITKTFAICEGVTLVGTWWGIIGIFVGPIYLTTNLIEYAKGSIAIARGRK